MRIISIGEILWDVFDRSEFIGGAPLNFSAHSQHLGNHVALISAIGDDERGRRTLSAIESFGLTTEFIQTIANRPTGTASVAVDASGNATYSIVRPAAYDFVNLDELILASVAAFDPNWIYFGTLAQTSESNEDKLLRLLDSCPGAGRFYDMNLRTGHWTLPLVERLCRIATVLKLNETEAEILFGCVPSHERFSLESFCKYWAEKYGLKTICVTLGGRGCAVFTSGNLKVIPGHPITVADTVGAGDAFAAAFLHGLELGWLPERTAAFANALGALVASRHGATPEWTHDELAVMCQSELNA